MCSLPLLSSPFIDMDQIETTRSDSSLTFLNHLILDKSFNESFVQEFFKIFWDVIFGEPNAESQIPLETLKIDQKEDFLREK